MKKWGLGWDNNDVRPQDVKDKWNNNCKWVWLQSCHILEEEEAWSQALNTCHIVLGFASKTHLSTSVITEFFLRAAGEDRSLIQAYKIATEYAFDKVDGNPVIGAAIADTYEQFTDDHLYGQGAVHPDELTNDDNYYFSSWRCDL